MPAAGRLLVLTMIALCGAGCSVQASQDYDWNLPPGFEPPLVPEHNPMSAAKVRLGETLFFDTILSEDGSRSCSSCHSPDALFSSPLASSESKSLLADGRDVPSLVNVAYAPTLTWANPELTTLEQHLEHALFVEDHGGLTQPDGGNALTERLRSTERYDALFAEAFGTEAFGADAISTDHVILALASFQRSLVSASSAYDQYILGSPDALSPSAKQGMALFFSERLECFHCHGGPNFGSGMTHEGPIDARAHFYNIGLYNLDLLGAYPASDRGVHDVTAKPRDMGKFRPPSLRNVTHTAPYMHDGSMTRLEDVVDMYAAGGRVIDSGPHAGDGRMSPLKSPYIRGFELTPEEKSALLAFLASLSDRSLTDSQHWSSASH